MIPFADITPRLEGKNYTEEDSISEKKQYLQLFLSYWKDSKKAQERNQI